EAVRQKAGAGVDRRPGQKDVEWKKLGDAATDLDLAFAQELGLPAGRDQLRLIRDIGAGMRLGPGGRPAGRGAPPSPFSRAPATPAPQVDENGRVKERLPAYNVAALGRSLFSDYLLAVALAGVLLTVATIGAIVIAGRRTEGLR